MLLCVANGSSTQSPASRDAHSYRVDALNGPDNGELMSSEWCGQHVADCAENDSSYESSHSVLSDSDVSCDNVVSTASRRRFTSSTQRM